MRESDNKERVYRVGTSHVLLRYQINNVKTGKVTNMFFDDFEQAEAVIEALFKASPDEYMVINFGGYDIAIEGC